MKVINFIIFITLISFFSCDVTDKDSDDFDNREKRIEILKAEIVSFSKFRDAEFELFNVNGFSDSWNLGVGASLSDYKLAIKVNQKDLDKWTEGMVKGENSKDDSWVKEIVKNRAKNWQVSGEPEFYYREKSKVSVIIYRNEGIIFKRIIMD